MWNIGQKGKKKKNHTLVVPLGIGKLKLRLDEFFLPLVYMDRNWYMNKHFYINLKRTNTFTST